MEQQELDIITRMNEKYMKMSKGHKAIAAYISDHYEQAVFMTAAELGKKVDISESSKINGLYKDVDASLFKSCIYLTQLETLLNQKGGYDE